MTNSKELRATFNQAARDYDAIRPGYPAELIDDIIALSALPVDGRILEVGCGTGQATLPFARRGYAMHCLDIGAELVAVAREHCRPYSNIDFEIVAFEDWEAPAETFHLVMSATAWHWVPPEIGYQKAVQALKHAGSLAIFSNMHTRPLVGFFQEVGEVYRSIAPELADPDTAPSIEENIETAVQQIEQTGLFESVAVKRYAWSTNYTRDEYLRLLNTYSNHLSLEHKRRARLHSAIGALIDREFGGIVERPYLSVLYLARRKADRRSKIEDRG
jgi:SAM-dependent methyltransferase